MKARRRESARARRYVQSARSSDSRDVSDKPDRGDMQSRFQGIRALATGVATGALAAFWGASAFAEELIGQPTDGALGMQPGVTPLKHDAIFFHDKILLPIITVI